MHYYIHNSDGLIMDFCVITYNKNEGDILGLLFKSKREKQLEQENQLLRMLMAAEAVKKNNTSQKKKSKLVTKQCKYCGHKVTYYANNGTPSGTCPRRKNGQPHIWQIIGTEYR